MKISLSIGSGLLVSLLSSMSWAQPPSQPPSASITGDTTPMAEREQPAEAPTLGSASAPSPTPQAASVPDHAPALKPSQATSSDLPLPTGVLLQARLQSQVNLLSLITSTSGFLVGYQFRGFALGLGVGLTRASYSADHTSTQESSSIDGTIWQIAPTALVDVWHSTDKRTRANVVASIGLGKGSFSYDSEVCETGYSDLRTCSANEKQTLSAFLIPIQVGFGGDHFLSRHFALGVETGFQYTFTTSIKTNGKDLSRDASMQAFYGLARFTLLIGA